MSMCSGSLATAGEGVGAAAGGAKAGEGTGEKRASLIGSTWSGAEIAGSTFGEVGAQLLTPPPVTPLAVPHVSHASSEQQVEISRVCGCAGGVPRAVVGAYPTHLTGVCFVGAAEAVQRIEQGS